MKKLATSYLYKTILFFVASLLTTATLVCVVGAAFLAADGYYDQPQKSYANSLLFRGSASDWNDAAWSLYASGITSDEYGTVTFMQDLQNRLDIKNTNYRYAVYGQQNVWQAGTAKLSFDEATQAGCTNVYWVDTNRYTVVGLLDETLPVQDAFAHQSAWFANVVANRYTLLWTGTAALVLTLATLVALCCAAGRYAGAEGPQLRNLNRIPTDVYTGVCLLLAFCACGISVSYCDEIGNDRFALQIGLLVAAAVAMAAVLVALLQSWAARIKTRTFWKNTLCWKILCWIGRALSFCFRGIRALFTNLPVLWQTIVVYCAFGLANVICLFSGGMGVVLAILVDLAVLALLCKLALDARKLAEAGQALAQGDMGGRVETKNMCVALRRHGDHLNQLQTGMQRAIAGQLKSERMKTDLITNVSHDLKTPLTSIVSYVDLLQKENLTGKAAEYTDVLARQAERLKKLTTDLVEASKASSGALNVCFEPVDLAELVNQSLGEYAERFAGAALTPVPTLPLQPLYARADGRLMWRVIDNLLSNAAKYAMPGTRIYLDAGIADGKASLQIKNISKEALNMTPEELMARFARGDLSRSTEGSGLGLSIAGDLMKLQNGALKLRIDGDLFQATAEAELWKGETPNTPVEQPPAGRPLQPTQG